MIWALLQTTGGKDEPNIVFIGKSPKTSQHGTKSIKHIIEQHKNWKDDGLHQ